MHSDDGDIQFLHKVSSRVQTQNSEMKRIGSNTPLFHMDSTATEQTIGNVALLVQEQQTESGVAVENQESPRLPEHKPESNRRPAIHMDAMAFGMGNCCLQITFQAKDIDESRFMFDQLAVLAPIMMALTASTPILKGRIADTDARWGIISEAVDCRTPAERGRDDPRAPYEDYNANGKRRIYKSRYDSISTFIYQGTTTSDKEEAKGLTDRVLNIYNDIPVEIDEESYKQLRNSGIDPALAQHVAHLFIRDPLVVFDGAVEEVDDEKQTDHFESIQSTNWYVELWDGDTTLTIRVTGRLFGGSLRLRETAQMILT
jgi:Glutamate-cysteine ligase